MNIKGLIFTVLEAIIKVIILAAAVMLILKGINKAYDFGYRVFADEPVSPNNGRTITVGIPENATVEDVAAMLEEKGLINDSKLFIVQEYLSAYHDKITSGIYDLRTDMTANEILAVIASGENMEDEDINSIPYSAQDTDADAAETAEEGITEEGADDALLEEDTGEASTEGEALTTEGGN